MMMDCQFNQSCLIQESSTHLYSDKGVRLAKRPQYQRLRVTRRGSESMEIRENIRRQKEENKETWMEDPRMNPGNRAATWPYLC